MRFRIRYSGTHNDLFPASTGSGRVFTSSTASPFRAVRLLYEADFRFRTKWFLGFLVTISRRLVRPTTCTLRTYFGTASRSSFSVLMERRVVGAPRPGFFEVPVRGYFTRPFRFIFLLQLSHRCVAGSQRITFYSRYSLRFPHLDRYPRAKWKGYPSYPWPYGPVFGILLISPIYGYRSNPTSVRPSEL